jgi:sugar-specific transcriptional regulator TrmB
MLEQLLNFGFKQNTAEIYVFLALSGPKRAKDIADALNTYKRKVYRALKELQDIEVIYSSQNIPARYSAAPFDKVLDNLKNQKLMEAEKMEAKKEKIIGLWDYG